MRPLLGRLMAGLMVLLPLTAVADPLGYAVGFDRLYRIDLATGQATPVGTRGLGFNDVEGLAFSANGVLYGVADATAGVGSGATDLLITIDTTSGTGTLVGAMPGLGGIGPGGNLDYGLAFTSDGRLWLSSDTTSQLWEVSPGNAATRLVGPLAAPISGLAGRGNELFGVSVDANPTLYLINPMNAVATPIGALNVGGIVADAGLDFDATGQLWAVLDPEPAAEGASRVVAINTASGLGNVVANASVASIGMEGLAIAPAGGSGVVVGAGPLGIPGPGLPMLAMLGMLAAVIGLRRLGTA